MWMGVCVFVCVCVCVMLFLLLVLCVNVQVYYSLTKHSLSVEVHKSESGEHFEREIKHSLAQ